MRTVLHPPVTPNPRMNWAAWSAAGNVIHPGPEHRHGYGGLLFVLAVVALIVGGMVATVWWP